MREKVYEAYNKYKEMVDCIHSTNNELDLLKDAEYQSFLKQETNLFKEGNKEFVKFVPYPNNSIIFERLVRKALCSEKPFQETGHKKKYTDAGFKDALIYETILDFVQQQDKTIVIFITQDRDFSASDMTRNISLYKSTDDVINLLEEKINTIERKLMIKINTDYNLRRILEMENIEYKECIFIKIERYLKVHDMEWYVIDIELLVDGKSSFFEVTYNLEANEISGVLSLFRGE